MAPPTTVWLRNTERRMVTLNLPHEFGCDESGCRCAREKVTTFDHDPKTGAVTPRDINKRLPTSITFLAGGQDGDTFGPLPASAKLAPEFAPRLRPGGGLVEVEDPVVVKARAEEAAKAAKAAAEAAAKAKAAPEATPPDASGAPPTDATLETAAPPAEPEAPSPRRRGREG